MPDTGAPWNIPYVESTDLVSDWPTDSLALANAIDAGLDAAGNAGIGTNVVQAVKTDTYSQTATAFATVTGLSVSITPTSASSKILLIANVMVSHTSDAGGYMFKLSGGNTADFVGDASGSRIRAVFGTENQAVIDAKLHLMPTVMAYLDSPSTTSPVTYTVQASQTRTGTLYVNRTALDSNTADFPRGASSLTAIEVAA